MSPTTLKCKRLPGQNGFTLLEVLIALLVLSIGLLGLAALQTVGLKSNQMAAMRTQATQAAYDITDRMRANQEGVDNDEYVFALIDTKPALPDCESATCTPAQLADYDLNNWLGKVGQLPGGRGRIIQLTPTSTLTVHTITVFWDEERTGATGTACGPDPETDLRCISLTVQ